MLGSEDPSVGSRRPAPGADGLPMIPKAPTLGADAPSLGPAVFFAFFRACIMAQISDSIKSALKGVHVMIGDRHAGWATVTDA